MFFDCQKFAQVYTVSSHSIFNNCTKKSIYGLAVNTEVFMQNFRQINQQNNSRLIEVC